MKPILNKARISLSGIVVLLLVGLAFFPLQVQAAPGQGILYGTDAADGNLITVDPTSGLGTIVGPTNVPGVVPSLAIGPSPANPFFGGTIFAGQGQGQPNFYELSPINGNSTFIGDSGLGFSSIAGMDFNADGTLCAAVNIVGDGGSGGDHLATIDPLTGLATIIGPFGACNGDFCCPSTGAGSCTINGIEAIAFDPRGNLWGSLRTSGGSSGTPGLYLINQDTGAATFVAPILDGYGVPPPRGGVVSLQFGCDGTLYGGTAQSGGGVGDGGFLVTIDPNTGIFSFVGGVSATGGTSLGGFGI